MQEGAKSRLMKNIHHIRLRTALTIFLARYNLRYNLYFEFIKYIIKSLICVLKRENLLLQKKFKRYEFDDWSLNIIKVFYYSDVSFEEKN